jgi:hypothetical protein
LNYEQIRFFVVATTYQVNEKRIIFFFASHGAGETEKYVPSMERETIRNKGFEKYGKNNSSKAYDMKKLQNNNSSI